MEDNDDSIYKQFSKFIANNLSEPHMAKLTKVSKIEDFPFYVQSVLRPFYESEDSTHKRIGSLLNSMFTQQNNVFLLVNAMLNDIVKNDPNHNLESCDREACDEVKLRVISKSNILTVLRKPMARSPGVRGRGGLYEVTHPMFTDILDKLMGAELRKIKKEEFLIWYDTTNPPAEDEVAAEPKTEEELRIERQVLEREERQSAKRNNFNH